MVFWGVAGFGEGLGASLKWLLLGGLEVGHGGGRRCLLDPTWDPDSVRGQTRPRAPRKVRDGWSFSSPASPVVVLPQAHGEPLGTHAPVRMGAWGPPVGAWVCNTADVSESQEMGHKACSFFLLGSIDLFCFRSPGTSPGQGGSFSEPWGTQPLILPLFVPWDMPHLLPRLEALPSFGTPGPVLFRL